MSESQDEASGKPAPRPRFRIRQNYAFLLAGLIFVFLLIPLVSMFPTFTRSHVMAKVAIQIGFSLMMLVGIWGLHREKLIFRLGLWLAGLSTAFASARPFFESHAIELIGYLWVILFCIMSGTVAARHVFRANRVDSNMLYGAVCVYLLMGLCWALFYGLIAELSPSAFNGMGSSEDRTLQFETLLYYSFVTLASLGYGDITPVLPLARTLAYLEAVSGQLYIAIMVAGLVGLYMRDENQSSGD